MSPACFKVVYTLWD